MAGGNVKSVYNADYASCFPRFRALGETDGSFVTELEYVGDATFEAVLIGRVCDVAFDPVVIIDRVTEIVGRLAVIPIPSETRVPSGEAFLNEVVEGLSRNVRAAGYSIDVDMGKCLNRAAFVPSICHRDLSAVNVMYSFDGGVRLIDPRHSVPGADVREPSLGSVAVDVAAFLVSLERKELERERLGLASLCLTDRFRSTSDAWVLEGRYNAFMLDLCNAHAYSVYLACRCDYCLAPERKWLYDLMRQRFEEVSRRIA